ncbi:hypothetical protein FOCC_FOCC013877 [Frankliniella occidentalis]|nr:hypothetical protein FOCC_FOCC013877 [Frankliniella occidentalis]
MNASNLFTMYLATVTGSLRIRFIFSADAAEKVINIAGEPNCLNIAITFFCFACQKAGDERSLETILKPSLCSIIDARFSIFNI